MQGALYVHDPFHLTGRILDGKYRLDSVIGEGGFGVVYAGRQLALDQPVAVKCLKPSDGGADVASFLREARVLFQLSHPGIVRMYDVGQIDPRALGVGGSIGGGPMPYVVLEHLAGRTLDLEIEARARENRPFTGDELVRLAEGMLDALAFAHGQGIVHRDIKPANVMIVPGVNGPTTKILDFGLARGGVSGNTSAGVGLTPRYAAPEQWNANYGAVGPLADLFALGLVIEEAATLLPALAGESLAEVVAATTSTTRRSRVSERRPDLSPAFAELVNRATRVAQSERFPSAAAMRDLLRTQISGGRPSGGLGAASSYAPPSPLAASMGYIPPRGVGPGLASGSVPPVVYGVQGPPPGARPLGTSTLDGPGLGPPVGHAHGPPGGPPLGPPGGPAPGPPGGPPPGRASRWWRWALQRVIFWAMRWQMQPAATSACMRPTQRPSRRWICAARCSSPRWPG